jgi:hypothetical protein
MPDPSEIVDSYDRQRWYQRRNEVVKWLRQQAEIHAKLLSYWKDTPKGQHEIEAHRRLTDAADMLSEINESCASEIWLEGALAARDYGDESENPYDAKGEKARHHKWLEGFREKRQFDEDHEE